jgi:hypothetical protein
MILIILILAKTCLKVFKVNCCRLMNHLPLELCLVRSVLLSVVTQALLCKFLCAGFFLSPSSGDADDGYQWDV